MILNDIYQTALTYFVNRDKLIYSYHGNTFLQGGDLYDQEHDSRGRIDCSTLVHLALQGIGFENSPFVTGEPEAFFGTSCMWKGEPVQSMSGVFAGRSDRASDIRRAYGLARYLRETRYELDPGEELKTGDLVFFRAGRSVLDKYLEYGAYLGISHVGIVAEDTEFMINATGRRDADYNAAHDAVRFTRIEDKGVPVIRARLYDNSETGRQEK